MIRCSRETSRACNGCGTRSMVLTLSLGREHIRICDKCFAALVAARQRLIIEQMESIEVGS